MRWAITVLYLCIVVAITTVHGTSPRGDSNQGNAQIMSNTLCESSAIAVSTGHNAGEIPVGTLPAGEKHCPQDHQVPWVPIRDGRSGKSRTISFKGIGINFVKSVIHWQTFGFNVVLPLSPNFPAYDSNIHFPRVMCYFGFYFPATVSATLTFSLPFQVVSAAVVQFARREQPTALADAFNSTSGRRLPVSDSVQRIGLRFSVRYDREFGCRGIVGPTVAYLPGAKVLEMAKPAVLWLPTALAFIGGSVLDGVDRVICIIVDMLCRMFERARATLHAACAGLNNSIWEAVGKGRHEKDVPATATSKASKAMRRAAAFNPTTRRAWGSKRRYSSAERWTRSAAWLRTKTLGFVMNLGYFATSYDRMMGSNVIFELQPFFPLHKQLAQRRPGRVYRLEDTVAPVADPLSAGNDTVIFPTNSKVEDNAGAESRFRTSKLVSVNGAES